MQIIQISNILKINIKLILVFISIILNKKAKMQTIDQIFQTQIDIKNLLSYLFFALLKILNF